MLKIRANFLHYFQAEAVVETEWMGGYFLEMIWMDLLARIIEIMKFSFSQRVFSSSFSILNR